MEPDIPIARVRVTLSWLHERQLVTEELRPDLTPRVFGRLTHDRISDVTVSREHFEIVCLDGLRWRVETLAPVNGLRLKRAGQAELIDVDGKARLFSGDQLHAGKTVFTFRIDGVLDHTGDGTRHAATMPVMALPPLQRILTRKHCDVVEQLCRPARRTDGSGPAWATNAAIAEALFVGVETVRTHLRDIYARLQREGLPEFADDVDANQKRLALLNLGLRAGFGERSGE
jgi:hypothetical protein